MPFIKPERRKIIDSKKGINSRYGLVALYQSSLQDDYIQPGDRCYVYYRKMVDRWRADPRWTTAHEIYKDIRSSTSTTYRNSEDAFENKIAEELAWQVFFIKWVWPYELEKIEQNGDIL